MMPYINEGRLASARGFANEQRLLAALLARGFNASRVDLPHSTYDIIVELAPDNLIRIQVKTIGKADPFLSSAVFVAGWIESIVPVSRNTRKALKLPI